MDWSDFYSDDYNNEDDEIFEDLMNLLDDIYEEIESLPKERPIFSDKQVMSFEDLIVGQHYLDWHKETYSEVILVTEPYQKDEGLDSWFAKVKSVRYSDFIYEISLADNGVIPYFNDGWNTSNYMTTL